MSIDNYAYKKLARSMPSEYQMVIDDLKKKHIKKLNDISKGSDPMIIYRMQGQIYALQDIINELEHNQT